MVVNLNKMDYQNDTIGSKKGDSDDKTDAVFVENRFNKKNKEINRDIVKQEE